jgi:hypothetical protein
MQTPKKKKNGISTATVTAVAPGTATITVSMMTYQETTYTATSTITVEDRSYCTPSFSNTTDYIANFTLGEINNSTGFSTNGYGDYTNLSASLEPGKFRPSPGFGMAQL